MLVCWSLKCVSAFSEWWYVIDSGENVYEMRDDAPFIILSLEL